MDHLDLNGRWDLRWPDFQRGNPRFALTPRADAYRFPWSGAQPPRILYVGNPPNAEGRKLTTDNGK